jgi:lysozyme
MTGLNVYLLPDHSPSILLKLHIKATISLFLGCDSSIESIFQFHMTRPLLLLIFFPVILIAQTRRMDIVDSNKDFAANNLKSIPPAMGNYPCTTVADMRIIDNGEYLTIFIYRHTITAADSAIRLDEENIPPGKVAIAALAPAELVKLNTEEIPVSKVELTLTLPPFPAVQDDSITTVPPLALLKLNMKEIPVSKMELILTLPSLPALQDDEITAVPPLALLKLNMVEIPVSKMELILTLPSLPALQDDEITDVPPLALLKLNMVEIPVSKMELILTILNLPILQEDSVTAVPTMPLVKLKTKEIPISNVDIILSHPPLPVLLDDIISTLQTAGFVKLKIAVYQVMPPEILWLPGSDEKRTAVEEMHLSAGGYSLLEKLEGFAPDLYTLGDGGYTLGFGFFIPYNEGHKWSKGITWEEAEHMIQQKVPAYEAQVKKYINIPLTQGEFDALTLMAYNIGGFSKATSIINDINNQVEFDKLQSDWIRFVHSKAPNVSKGLMKRRKDELEVRRVSDYQPERKIQVFKSRK